jgi:hypothetical protein
MIKSLKSLSQISIDKGVAVKCGSRTAFIGVLSIDDAFRGASPAIGDVDGTFSGNSGRVSIFIVVGSSNTLFSVLISNVCCGRSFG